jgi:hypothetical protein
VAICVGDGVGASWCDVVSKLGWSSWDVQVGVVKLGCSSRGVQVGVLWISWFPFFDGVSLPTTRASLSTQYMIHHYQIGSCSPWHISFLHVTLSGSLR